MTVIYCRPTVDYIVSVMLKECYQTWCTLPVRNFHIFKSETINKLKLVYLFWNHCWQLSRVAKN